jgi:hypothetical protein
MLLNKQYFREMTLPQKIKYLFSYYSLSIIIVTLAVIFTVYLVKPTFENKKYNAHCLILNDTENTGLVEQLKNGFPKFVNNEKILIEIDNGFPFVYIEEEGINLPEGTTIYNLLSRVPNHTADIIIADYKTMLWAVYQEFVYPIDTILPKQLLEKLEPYFVYACFQNEDECKRKVYGLNISDTDVYKGHSVNYEEAIVLIPNITKQPEVGIKFVQYIFGIE